MHHQFLFELRGAFFGLLGACLFALRVLKGDDSRDILEFGLRCYKVMAVEINFPLPCLCIKKGIVMKGDMGEGGRE